MEDLQERAREIAGTALGRRYTLERYELELEREGEERWNHLFLRPFYDARFKLFEAVGVAAVSLGGGAGPVVRFPCVDPPETGIDATPEELGEARELAEDAARRAGRTGPFRTSIASASRQGSRLEVRVRVLEPPADSLVTVDLDAFTGERLGYHVHAFLRGSRSGRPLTPREAAARAEAEEPPPPGAVLSRAELTDGPGTREWRIRYDVLTPDAEGHFLVSVHARTGSVAGVTSTVRQKGDLGAREARARAEALVARVLPQVLGEDARLAALVPGALVRGRRATAGWVGTATTAEGTVARVSLSGDEVEVALRGKAFKTRVLVPAPRPV